MQLEKERIGLEKKFFDLACQVVSNCGLELYDLEYVVGSHLLRLYIADPKTNSALIDDCVKVDRAMTPFIDAETWMPSELTLEVSSPGLYRHLRSREHFTKAKGQRICLSLHSPVSFLGPKAKVIKRQKVLGMLSQINEDHVVIKIVPEEVEQTVTFDQIKKANLDPLMEEGAALLN